MNNDKIISDLHDEFVRDKQMEENDWDSQEELLEFGKFCYQEAQKHYDKLKSQIQTQQDKTRKKVANSETEDKLSVNKEDKTAEPLELSADETGLSFETSGLNESSAPKDEDRREE